jgi:Protein of unknown function (DUF742)
MEDSEDTQVSLVRPFLGRKPVDLDTGINAPGQASGSEDVGVRPYYLTGGRTRSGNERVSFESIVVRGEAPLSNRDKFERAELIALCAEPQSMAELSAKLRLPIGVVCVLCGDLAEAGVLNLHEAPVDVADDVELIDMLIDVLRQL